MTTDFLNGLIACYEDWDSGAGTLTMPDSHTGGHDLTASSAIVTVADGVVGASSISFSGTSHLKIINNAFLPGLEMHVTCWFKATAMNLWDVICGIGEKSLGGDWPFRLVIENVTNRPMFVCTGSFREVVNSLYAISTGTWYFVDAGYSETDGHAWIRINDGALAAIQDNSATFPVLTTHNQFLIGANETNGDPFEGYISQIALWNRRLTTEEVTALYNSGNGLSYSSFGGGSSPSLPVARSRKFSLCFDGAKTIFPLVSGGTGTVPAPITGWTVDNKKLFKDGEPFFPLGFYYNSGYESYSTLDAGTRALHFDAAQAMNCNTLYLPLTASDPCPAELEARGIYFIWEANGSEAAIDAEMAAKPNALGPYLFDDMDNGTHTVGEVQARNNARKAAMPDLPTYGSGGTFDFDQYYDIPDLSGFQAYLFWGNGDLEWGDTFMDEAADAAAAAGNAGWLLNLQCFDPDSGGGTYSYPNAGDLRGLFYMGLIKGMTGCVAFTLYAPTAASGWNFYSQTALHSEVAALYGEAEDYKNYYILGTRTTLTTSDSSKYLASSFSYDGKLLVLVMCKIDDTSGTTTDASFTVTLPAGLSNKTSPIARYNDNATYSGTTLTVNSIAKEEVRVFLFDE